MNRRFNWRWWRCRRFGRRGCGDGELRSSRRAGECAGCIGVIVAIGGAMARRMSAVPRSVCRSASRAGPSGAPARAGEARVQLRALEPCETLRAVPSPQPLSRGERARLLPSPIGRRCPAGADEGTGEASDRKIGAGASRSLPSPEPLSQWERGLGRSPFDHASHPSCLPDRPVVAMARALPAGRLHGVYDLFTKNSMPSRCRGSQRPTHILSGERDG